jgi:hypothetical protein
MYGNITAEQRTAIVAARATAIKDPAVVAAMKAATDALQAAIIKADPTTADAFKTNPNLATALLATPFAGGAGRNGGGAANGGGRRGGAGGAGGGGGGGNGGGGGAGGGAGGGTT